MSDRSFAEMVGLPTDACCGRLFPVNISYHFEGSVHMVSANWIRRLGVFCVMIAFAMIATSQANAAIVTGTFDLTSPGPNNVVLWNPATFTADAGITVQAFGEYSGTQRPSWDRVETNTTGAGVVDDQWIRAEYDQRLVFRNWSVPGRLVGFTVHDDGVNNPNSSGVRLFNGFDLVDVWTVQNGQDLFVDLSSYSGLDGTKDLSFWTTVDVDSSFAVKELTWEYNATVPEPASIAIWSVFAVGVAFSAARARRRRA